MSRGLVKDNSTDLLWTRCPLSGNDIPIFDFQCSGEKKLYTWSAAVEACNNLVYEGRSDWRLPNINELQSIAYYHHYVSGSSNISQVVVTAFPNAVTVEDAEKFWFCLLGDSCYTHYWSSSIKDENISLVLDFNTGGISFGKVIHYKAVRCVAGP